MRVGVTGHQRLNDPSSWDWVSSQLRDALKNLPRPLVGLTSLAIGTDQDFGRAILEQGGQLRAVIPFEGIERTFAPGDLPEFKRLLASADAEILPQRGSDEDAFLAAGKRIVDQSDLMIAVWDQQPAKGKGGTADIVEYARVQGIPVLLLDPTTRSVGSLSAKRAT